MSGSSGHDLLLYRDPGDLVRQVAPLISAARQRGQAVVVAAPGALLEHVEPLLGDDPGDAVIEADEVALNPSRMFELWLDTLERTRATHPGLVGFCQHIWPGRSQAEVDECWIVETLCGLGVADTTGLRMHCLFDHSALDPATIERAHEIHRRRALTDDERADALRALLEGDLTAVPHHAESHPIALDTLAELRSAARRAAHLAGLGPRRADDLVLAAHELAANSVRHGGGSGSLALWSDGSSLWCEVADHGRLHDPMIGRRRPPADDLGGRGVWIAHQVCDLVQVRSTDAGTRVRLRMALA